jgi:hypothetical protein
MLEDTTDGELNKRRVSLREMGQAERRKEGTTARKDGVSRGDKTYHIKSYEVD